jgi:hypothetical protein
MSKETARRDLRVDQAVGGESARLPASHKLSRVHGGANTPATSTGLQQLSEAMSMQEGGEASQWSFQPARQTPQYQTEVVMHQMIESKTVCVHRRDVCSRRMHSMADGHSTEPS